MPEPLIIMYLKKITYDTLNDNQNVLPILNAAKQNIFNED